MCTLDSTDGAAQAASDELQSQNDSVELGRFFSFSLQPTTRCVCHISRSAQRCSRRSVTRPCARLGMLRQVLGYGGAFGKRPTRERKKLREALSPARDGNTSFEGRTTTQSVPEQAGACGRPRSRRVCCEQRNPQGGHEGVGEDLRPFSGPPEALCGVAGALQQSRAKLQQIPLGSSVSPFASTGSSRASDGSRSAGRPAPRVKILRHVCARTPKWMLADAKVINKMLLSVAPKLLDQPAHCRTHRVAPARTTLSPEPNDRSGLPGTNAVSQEASRTLIQQGIGDESRRSEKATSSSFRNLDTEGVQRGEAPVAAPSLRACSPSP